MFAVFVPVVKARTHVVPGPQAEYEAQHPTTAQKSRAQFQPKPLYEEVERAKVRLSEERADVTLPVGGLAIANL